MNSMLSVRLQKAALLAGISTIAVNSGMVLAQDEQAQRGEAGLRKPGREHGPG